MNDIISIFEASQNEYLSGKDKVYLKDTSQFFTPYDIACKMIETIDSRVFKVDSTINILEPSAGCGILIAALVLNIAEKYKNIKKINIDLYEYDKTVFNILSNNLNILNNYMLENYDIDLKFNILNENFILKNSNTWTSSESGEYDIIISNPPYKKINQTSPESKLMSSVVHGQPNIYTLFIAMCLKLLKKNGVYTVLSPRNYFSGEYSKKLRNFIFENYSLTHIYFFEKRSMFKSVNQEVIISTYINNKFNKQVDIHFDENKCFLINFNDIIFDKNLMSIVIPKNQNDLNLLKSFSKLKFSLTDLNLKISVGPVVQFRNVNDIKKDLYDTNYAPLVISADIQSNNRLIYFERENKRKTHNKSISIDNKWIIKNSNYLVIRKVTAKDDIDLIVAAVLNRNYFNHSFLAFDNNLLYIHHLNKEDLDLNICYGLYCFINSSQFKKLYMLINGTHTINVTDFNNIKFPSYVSLIKLGKNILKISDYSEKICTELVEKYLNIKYK
ncbi:site-specific modification DNA-methyltransferase [[Clostridium] sordellii]|uniref:Eco57I restriction-modification methylase domain-containing protein n=1 Tax=Paraclostridium sordellii TaxID=1505 RepID=UPI0005E6F414|nr:Eco57I restriction-modification methylase domain-containing protein [Paeniclostridium sordellii]CEN31005.1 site-specific modification DNA-methyltransferase [[Clostridium] sordellii] [Paeniclostridium sordellii]